MPTLTAAEFEAIVASGIDTATIEAAISREESALARRLGGPLEGERTDTLYPAGHDGPLTLRRFAGTVTVTSDGTTLDATGVRLVADGRACPGGAIERASGAWGDVVTITSTPDDAEAMTSAAVSSLPSTTAQSRMRSARCGRAAPSAATTPYACALPPSSMRPAGSPPTTRSPTGGSRVVRTGGGSGPTGS